MLLLRSKSRTIRNDLSGKAGSTVKGRHSVAGPLVENWVHTICGGQWSSGLISSTCYYVFLDVTTQLVAILFEISRMILRDALIRSRHQNVSLEQTVLIKLL